MIIITTITSIITITTIMIIIIPKGEEEVDLESRPHKLNNDKY